MFCIDCRILAHLEIIGVNSSLVMFLSINDMLLAIIYCLFFVILTGDNALSYRLSIIPIKYYTTCIYNILLASDICTT